MHIELREESELQSRIETLVPEAKLIWQNVPGTALEGYLVEELSACEPLSARSTELVMEAPPFWSLLWPSGNHLCRMMGEGFELLRGRTCVDLGCGSGLVSTAAARAGAGVLAVDSDPLSQMVTSLNLARNRADCRIADSWLEGRCDTLLLADFLYDDSNIEALGEFCARCGEILVVDSRLKQLDMTGFELLGDFEGRAVPDLDPHREFGCLKAWYWGERPEEWRHALGQTC